MRKCLLSFLLLFPLLQPSFAAGNEDLINTLLGVGSRVLQAEQARRASAAAEQQNQPWQPEGGDRQAPPLSDLPASGLPDATPQQGAGGAPAEPDGALPPRLGSAALAVLLRGLEEGAAQGNGNIAQWLPDTLKQTLDTFTQAYKEEGRAYAREMGDILAQRLLENRKVDRTLTNVQMLCWGVVIYLTLVTMLIFFWAWRVKCSTKRLMLALEELQRLQREQRRQNGSVSRF